MTMIVRATGAHDLDPEARAALGRLDDDLRAVETAVGAAALPSLRRRAISAFEDALREAAGQPDDPRWRLFLVAVAAFTSRVPEMLLGRVAKAAMIRLNRLVSENSGAMMP
jgi:hypothetical protein